VIPKIFAPAAHVLAIRPAPGIPGAECELLLPGGGNASYTQDILQSRDFRGKRSDARFFMKPACFEARNHPYRSRSQPAGEQNAENRIPEFF